MTRRIVAQIHLWIGLVLCLPLMLIGITGSLLVLEDAFTPALAPSAAAAPAHPIAEIVAAARKAARPDLLPSMYMPASHPGERAMVRLAPAHGGGFGEGASIAVDPVSLQAAPQQNGGFFRQVSYLHTSLLLKNRDGRQLVGGFGVAMLVMTASGLVNWWPRRGRWRAAFTVSPRSRGYLLHRELHGVAGICGLAVLVVVSFGGVYLALPDAVRSVVGVVMPARDLRGVANAVKVQPQPGATPISADAAVSLARGTVPDGELRAVFLPQRPDQPYRVGLLRPGQERRETAVMVFVDPWTSRVVQILDPREFSLGEDVLAAQHAMHAGEGFGPIWKGLVFLSGLLPPLFAATGVAMWVLKRRRQPATRAPSIDDAYPVRSPGE